MIENVALSDDIAATLQCVRSLGAAWDLSGSTLRVIGNGGRRLMQAELPFFDCGESGSTLRFMIPIALALAGGGIFKGSGRLMDRPLEPYFRIFREKEISYRLSDDTLTVQGTLPSGEFRLAGNVSSQFFTGLLFALPLVDGPSLVVPTTAVESADYIAMTIDVLQRFGISTGATFTLPPQFMVSGRETYHPCSAAVEADWSQATFWYAAHEMGSSVAVSGMAENSPQGDSIFPHWMELLRRGGEQVIDASQNPDLVPPLAARAAVMNGSLRITNIARLRMKESDRIAAIADTLSALGAYITAGENFLVICGKEELSGGTTIDCRGDHRIAMMLAIAATRCSESITLTGAECVRKSYPNFWEDYKNLGGIAHEHSGK